MTTNFSRYGLHTHRKPGIYFGVVSWWVYVIYNASVERKKHATYFIRLCRDMYKQIPKVTTITSYGTPSITHIKNEVSPNKSTGGTCLVAHMSCSRGFRREHVGGGTVGTQSSTMACAAVSRCSWSGFHCRDALRYREEPATSTVQYISTKNSSTHHR